MLLTIAILVSGSFLMFHCVDSSSTCGWEEEGNWRCWQGQTLCYRRINCPHYEESESFESPAVGAGVCRATWSHVQGSLEHFRINILFLNLLFNFQNLKRNNANLQPDFKVIKKRIEDLITRDYLERDKDNPTLFRYLAWSGLGQRRKRMLRFLWLEIARKGNPSMAMEVGMVRVRL